MSWVSWLSMVRVGTVIDYCTASAVTLRITTRTSLQVPLDLWTYASYPPIAQSPSHRSNPKPIPSCRATSEDDPQ